MDGFGANRHVNLEEPGQAPTLCPMHYDAHQPIINDIEARILTIRDSL